MIVSGKPSKKISSYFVDCSVYVLDPLTHPPSWPHGTFWFFLTSFNLYVFMDRPWPNHSVHRPIGPTNVLYWKLPFYRTSAMTPCAPRVRVKRARAETKQRKEVAARHAAASRAGRDIIHYSHCTVLRYSCNTTLNTKHVFVTLFCILETSYSI